MSQEHDTIESNGFNGDNFEKNRYFQGKLMTARDMQAEQRYHTHRLNLLSRLIHGSGIVSGLTVSELQEQDDAIRVTVEPGVAIDGHGRPIVVANATTTRLPTPDSDEIYLQLAYDERTKDPVPVPGSEPLSGEQTQESRILEVFEITYTETKPNEYKPIHEVTFPTLDRTDIGDPMDVAHKLATTYHEEMRADEDSRGDPSVFLGSFKRSVDGEWKPGEETTHRPFVYDNDMLFAIVMSHIVDTDNPHGTTIGESADFIDSELDQIDRFSVRLERMRSELSAFSETIQRHTNHATRKSLKNTIRHFDEIADRFDDEPEVPRLAFTITNHARETLSEDAHATEGEYIEFVTGLSDDAREIGELLEDDVTDISYEQYVDAIEDLEAAIDEALDVEEDDPEDTVMEMPETEDDTTLLDVAIALDVLAEAAGLLERRLGVVPQGDD